MSIINPYHNALSGLYAGNIRAQEVEQIRPQPAQQAEAARIRTEAPDAGLSTAERDMITSYFPPTERLSLRVYGPGTEGRTLNPDALGGRLDLKG